MRTTDERLQAVEKRSREIRQERRDAGTMWICGSACLAVIIAAAFWMPALIRQADATSYGDSGLSGSVFGGSSAAGYLLIGLLAFALGVAATVLGVTLKRRREREKEPND